MSGPGKGGAPLTPTGRLVRAGLEKEPGLEVRDQDELPRMSFIRVL